MAKDLLIPVKQFQRKPGFFKGDDFRASQVTSKRMKHEQGYELQIESDRIVLVSCSAAGAYYGRQTLNALRDRYGDKIPCCLIKDKPDFDRRGVYLDCSRGKVPELATLKKLIEQLAQWKVNELQLYVENVFAFVKHPSVHAGFDPYSAGDLLEIQEHCRKHFIDFVPSLTSFGHFERILSLPEYAHLGEKPGHWGYPGGTTLCPGDRGSIKLVSELYDEFLPLFDSVHFNACCDETYELGKGRSKRRADKHGKGLVYLDFVKKLHRLSQKHGKRTHIWSDIILNYPECVDQVPKDIVMLNWDYEPPGLRMRESQRFVDAELNWIACPGTSAWGGHTPRLENSFINIRKFAAAARRYKAEGILNTDWGDFGHRNVLGTSLPGLAYGAAHAWHGRGVDDAGFMKNFCREQFGESAAAAHRYMEKASKVQTLVGEKVPYYSLMSAMNPQRSALQHIPPRSPLYLPDPVRKDWIADADIAGCRKAIALLNKIDVPKGGKTRSAQLMLKEWELAGQLDKIACQRILLADQLRAGKSISKTEKTYLAKDLADCSKAFEKLWMARNRRSRLDDNLRLFGNLIAELG